MQIVLPERASGARATLVALEVTLDPADEDRQVEVTAQGPLEALDLAGEGIGGLYLVPSGVDQLHVPLRVTADGAARADVSVRILEGAGTGTVERRSIALEAPAWVQPPRRSAARILTTAACGLVVLGLGAWVVSRYVAQEDKVPHLIGLSQSAAEGELLAAGYRIALENRAVPGPSDVGRVLETEPRAGETLAKGGTITLTVGVPERPLIAVPDLVGRKAVEATALLRERGLTPRETLAPTDERTQWDHVLRQSPASGHLASGSVVDLFVGGEPDREDQANGLTAEGEGALEPPPPAEAEAAGESDAAEGAEDATASEPVDEEDVPVASAPVSSDPRESPPAEIPVDPAAGALVAGGDSPPIADDDAPVSTRSDGPAPAVPETGEAASSSAAAPDGSEESAPQPEGEPGQPPGDGGEPAIAPAVPGLVGATVAEAEERCEELGLYAIFSYRVVADAAKNGTVVRQSPPADSPVPPGRTVFLTVARASADSPPPPPHDLPADSAPADPTPAQPELAAPQPVPAADALTVPDVVAQPREDAVARLESLGYRVEVIEETADFVPQGWVLSQAPTPGTPLHVGGMVRLAVARPATAMPAVVPSVVGMRRSEAEAALHDAGFQVEVRAGRGRPEDLGRVITQDPPAGRSLAGGSTVTIGVASIGGTSPVGRGEVRPIR